MAHSSVTGIQKSKTMVVIGRHHPHKSTAAGSVSGRHPMDCDIDGKIFHPGNMLGNHQVAASLGVIEAMRRADEESVTDLVIRTTSDRIELHDNQTWSENEATLRALSAAIRMGKGAFDSVTIVVI